MKTLITIAFVSMISSFAHAEAPSLYYVVDDYSCQTSDGNEINYNADSNPNKVNVVGHFGIARSYWVIGNSFFKTSNTSELAFTGHQSSAGPVVDPWESDFFIVVPGQLEVSKKQTVQGQLFMSTAYGPRVLVSQVSCLVNVQRSF